MSAEDFFLDREGRPIGGKVPDMVRFHGGGDYARVRAAAGAALNGFLHNAHQSIVNVHQQEYALGGGAGMRVESVFGALTVDIYVPPEEPAGGPFYGGILINPHVITGDEAAYLSLAGNPTPWRVPDAVKSAGALPGRPAVPGTGDASTEWLVVQISRDLPLTGDPLATGAVRMYRITNPLFGVFCEVAEPGRYAVSTKDGSAFFMCGKQLTHVPPMPSGLPVLGRSSEAGGGPSPYSIRTVGFVPSSFEAAAQTDGIIIFALVNQLWALNTRERTESTPAPWRLLATVSMPRDYPADYLPNEFGAVFSVAIAGGNYTLTCSGTNAVGTCSGFTVTINALGTMSGTLTLVDSGFRASVAHSQTVSFSGSYSRPRASMPTVDAWDFSFPTMRVRDFHSYLHDFPEACNPEVTYYGHEVTGNEEFLTLPNTRHVAYDVLGVNELHTLDVSVVGPSPAIVPDFVMGGAMPRRTTEYRRTFSENGQTSCELVGFFYRLKGSFALNRWTYVNNDYDITWNVECNPVYDTSGSTSARTKLSYLGQFGAAQNSLLLSDPSAHGYVLEDLDLSLFLSNTEFKTYYQAAYEALGVGVSFRLNGSGLPDWAVTFPGEFDSSPGLENWQKYRWGELYINTVDINNGRVFSYSWTEQFGSPDIGDLTSNIDLETDYRRTITYTVTNGHMNAEGPDSAVARYFPEAPDFDHRREPPAGISPYAKTQQFEFVVPTLPPAVLTDTPTHYYEYGPAFTAGPVPGDERNHYLNFNSGAFLTESISRYPKRSAVFSPVEEFQISDAYVGSLLGMSFLTHKKRDGGQLVANEHYTHGLPTNVSGFPTAPKPIVTKSENRQVSASGAYERDPYLRYADTTRDWHCGTMTWRRDAGRSGTWSLEDRQLRAFANNGERSLVHDTADRVEMSHTLYRAHGTTVMTFPDLLSFYPRRDLHGPLTVTSNIINVGAPYLQHDLVYADKLYPELDDSDSFGIPQTGGTVGDAYNLDEGDVFFFDTECLPRREWMPRGPYRAGWTPNRPQLLVGYWGKDANGGTRDPLFPVPGYWIPNPEEDPPEGEEYIHVPHITEASETNFNLVRPEFGFSPDFSGGMFLNSPRGAEFYELQARNFLGDIGAAFDALYVDNRTGGFITQVLWSGNGGRICETYIGNRTGIVPFRPIFDAWLALGGGAEAEGTKIAIARPPTSIGGPAPGLINPQQVSLL